MTEIELRVKEYEALLTRLSFIEREVWQRALLTFGIALGMVITLAQAQRHDIVTTLTAFFGAVGATIVLRQFTRFASRQERIILGHFHRLNHLEVLLGMRSVRVRHILDHWEEGDPWGERITEADRSALRPLYDDETSQAQDTRSGWRVWHLITRLLPSYLCDEMRSPQSAPLGRRGWTLITLMTNWGVVAWWFLFVREACLMGWCVMQGCCVIPFVGLLVKAGYCP